MFVDMRLKTLSILIGLLGVSVIALDNYPFVYAEDDGGMLDLLDDENEEREDKVGDDNDGGMLDLLGEEEEEIEEATEKVVSKNEVQKMHEKLLLEDKFPSAHACATCHPSHFRQWSMSPHSYAQLSPVFNAFQATLLKLTNGTNGDFCIRCHTPVGMNSGEPLYISNLERKPASREGVTCIACHRLTKSYGIVSGRLAIAEGSIFEPVYGPTGGDELKRVIDSADYVVNANPEESGRNIHKAAIKSSSISESASCASCHDVRFVNGFRLEDAFSEYKTSPAAKKGISCQDCHMGKIPGVPSGYDEGPAALVGNVPTRIRKLTDHRFPGPDYSIVHPGIFPHNAEAAKMASMAEWLTFDYEAGWGLPRFENNVQKDFQFPTRWKFRPIRTRARDILNEQFAKLKEMNKARRDIMRVGFVLGEVRVIRADEKRGIKFKVQIQNGTDGHGVPTGFDAERIIFLQVTVTDADGKVVFKSGDRDPNGDVRDLHSLYVHNGELPLDKYLFSLQSKFITLNLRGGEREQVLTVNYSVDPLPFVRPATRATTIYGQPRMVRKHKKIIPPLKDSFAVYKVKSSELTGQPPYKANIKLIAQMIPINLLHAIKDIGFDYGMSAKQVGYRILHGLDPEQGLEGAQILRERNVVLTAGVISQPTNGDIPKEARSNE